VIDSQTVAAGPATDLLRAFSGRQHVELFETDPSAPGRIELATEDTDRDLLDVRYIQDGEVVRNAALHAAQSMREHARQLSGAGADCDATWRALALLRASQRHEVDALVSSVPVLRAATMKDQARKGHVCTAEDGCALLGLCLRAHNDFTVRVDGNQATFLGHEQFYRAAIVAALPDFEDSLRAVWALWREDQRARPFALLRAVEIRMARALIARDYANVRIRHWRPDETWNEVLYFFESILLSFGGALDACARLLDATSGLGSKAQHVRVRNKDWRKEIAGAAPALTELLQDGSHFRGVVDLIATLRNFIHGEALSAELVSDTGNPHVMDYGQGVLVVTGATATSLTEAASQAGGSAAWGIEQAYGDATTIMPIQFQRQALKHVLQALREAMATGVVSASAPALTVPFDRQQWLTSAENDVALRLLLGLSDGAAGLS
jgi:hypothetical protein